MAHVVTPLTEVCDTQAWPNFPIKASPVSHLSDKKRLVLLDMDFPSSSQQTMDNKQDYPGDDPSFGQSGEANQPRVLVRPPIDYSSPRALACSVWARWKSLWTKRFIFSLIAGQVVSLCITVTNVTTTELVNRNWSLPTTQNWFLYVSHVAVGMRH